MKLYQRKTLSWVLVLGPENQDGERALVNQYLVEERIATSYLTDCGFVFDAVVEDVPDDSRVECWMNDETGEEALVHLGWEVCVEELQP